VPAKVCWCCATEKPNWTAPAVCWCQIAGSAQNIPTHNCPYFCYIAGRRILTLTLIVGHESRHDPSYSRCTHSRVPLFDATWKNCWQCLLRRPLEPDKKVSPCGMIDSYALHSLQAYLRQWHLRLHQLPRREGPPVYSRHPSQWWVKFYVVCGHRNLSSPGYL